MTRLLQIMAGAKVGGAEKFFERLAIAFHNAGIEQHIAIRQNAERENLLREAGLHLSNHRLGGIFDFKSHRNIQQIATQFKPDISLAWMSRGARFMPKGDFTTVARLGGYYDLKYFKKCEHLIGNTQDICKYLREKGWPEDKVWYLPNFVDDTIMPPQSREELNTPEDAPLMLGLGRLHENKAFDLGLEVIAKLPNTYYWIAGTGPKELELKQQAEKLGITDRVRFLGWRTDIAALFAAADIFLCTSRHEPLGNMMIEAWAHGTPVIAAAAQGPTEHISHGHNGLLSPIDDADKMAQNVQQLLDNKDLSIEIASNGNQSYKEAYTEGQVVTKYQEFFDKILKTKS
ncbi:glycosyltransferase [Curvivirga aplysinae]|uniref:glycosyltransferase n=1 Tax=Curvivirga aplysinae TaxID=2529852 RepID=UPI0012BC64AF|nr:glycosyltransferase [Curvivirga aplysinae]MTI10422.1 glycosyltransferase [Curvivirga aplysinae]